MKVEPLSIDIVGLVGACSYALDCIEAELVNVKNKHGKRVAYISDAAFKFLLHQLQHFRHVAMTTRTTVKNQYLHCILSIFRQRSAFST